MRKGAKDGVTARVHRLKAAQTLVYKIYDINILIFKLVDVLLMWKLATYR